jgi:hypothetical protein
MFGKPFNTKITGQDCQDANFGPTKRSRDDIEAGEFVTQPPPVNPVVWSTARGKKNPNLMTTKNSDGGVSAIPAARV